MHEQFSIPNDKVKEQKPDEEYISNIIRSISDKEQKEKLSNFLESLDFDLIKILFKTLVKKNVVNSDNINILDPKAMFATHVLTSGIFMIDFNQIGINLRATDRGLKLMFKDKLNDNIIFLRYLHIVIHELTHAISFRKMDKWHPEVKTGEPITQNKGKKGPLSGIYEQVQTGYATLNRKEDLQEYIEFNEGVTEMIAFEIMNEYLKKMKAPQLSDLKLYKDIWNLEYIGRYSLLVDKMIDCIVQKAIIPKQVVWQAIKRSYLEGVNFQDSELGRLIDEHTYQGFLNEIRAANADNDNMGIDNNTEKPEFYNCIKRLSDITKNTA